MDEPLTIYTSLPRSPIPLSECALHDINIGGNLLVMESSVGVDLLSFLYDLVTVQKLCPQYY